MSSLFIKNIGTMVTCDDDDNVFNDVNMLISDGEIRYIGKEQKEG